MFEASVKYVWRKDCFARSLGLPLQDGQAVSIARKGKTTVVTVSSAHKAEHPVLELSSAFAHSSGLPNGAKVTISVVDSVLACEEITLEPLTSDDFEVLELNKEAVEANLLQQIRAVQPGLEFPVWVQDNFCILVRVGDVTPSAASYALLNEDTLTLVAPAGRERKPVPSDVAHSVDKPSHKPNELRQSHQSKDRTSASLTNPNVSGEQTDIPRLDGDLSAPSGDADAVDMLTAEENRPNGQCQPSTSTCVAESSVKEKNGGWGSSLRKSLTSWIPTWTDQFEETKETFRQECLFFDELALRIQPIPKLSFDQSNCKNLTCSHIRLQPVVYIRQYDSPLDRPFLAILSRPSTTSASKLKGHYKTDLVVRVIPFPYRPCSTTHKNENDTVVDASTDQRIDCSPRCAHFDHFVGCHMLHMHAVVVSPMLMKELQLTDYMSVTLRRADAVKLVQPKELIARGLTQNDCERLKLVGESGLQRHFTRFLGCGSQLRPMVTLNRLNRVDVGGFTVVFDLSTKEDATTGSAVSYLTVPLSTFSFGTPLEVALGEPEMFSAPLVPVCYVRGECHRRIVSRLRSGMRMSCVVYGPSGSGKTALLATLASDLSGVAVCPVYVGCKMLRGKSVDNIRTLLSAAVERASQCAPSVFFLDDLHEICSSGSAMEQLTPGNDIVNLRMSYMLQELMTGLSSSDVSVVASAPDRSALHPSLITVRGNCLFHLEESVGSAGRDERLKFLRCFLQEEVAESSRLGQVLDDFAYKLEGLSWLELHKFATILLAASVEGGNWDAVFDDAMSELQGVMTSQSRLSRPDPSLSFNLIAGMGDIKTQLTQIFVWPLKYQSLYNRVPVRLPRGALLFGPSGCGKTLIAKTVAAESQCRFILIKGPELLSKYIGASEEAVRSTFDRAKRAKPCLIFFDEFDALAPRRGHDSTGVTDRVVNQLLTELDGVEDREGVFVIAASSRPDLIDPALLRPGRIDVKLHCGYPSQEARLTMLQSLAASRPDVDLDSLAASSAGFSGADLRAAVSSAQLKAVHSAMDHGTLSEGVCPSNDLLSESFEETQQDATRLRRRLMDSLYDDFARGSSTLIPGNRTSLA